MCSSFQRCTSFSVLYLISSVVFWSCSSFSVGWPVLFAFPKQPQAQKSYCWKGGTNLLYNLLYLCFIESKAFTSALLSLNPFALLRVFKAVYFLLYFCFSSSKALRLLPALSSSDVFSINYINWISFIYKFFLALVLLMLYLYNMYHCFIKLLLFNSIFSRILFQSLNLVFILALIFFRKYNREQNKALKILSSQKKFALFFFYSQIYFSNQTILLYEKIYKK